MLECGAVQKFHGDKGAAVGVTNFVDGADVRVIQCRSGPRLAAKPFQSLRVLRQAFRKEFESDGAAEFGVFGLVDYTHATAS